MRRAGRVLILLFLCYKGTSFTGLGLHPSELIYSKSPPQMPYFQNSHMGGGVRASAYEFGRNVIQFITVYTQKLNYCLSRAQVSISQYAFLPLPFVVVGPWTPKVLLISPLRSMAWTEQFNAGWVTSVYWLVNIKAVTRVKQDCRFRSQQSPRPSLTPRFSYRETEIQRDERVLP